MFVKGFGKHWCKYPPCVHYYFLYTIDVCSTVRGGIKGTADSISAIMHSAVLYIPAVRSYNTWRSYI